MAAKLANIHQRDYILLSHEPIDLRKQHVDSEALVGGSL